jgi:hypothetical protein
MRNPQSDKRLFETHSCDRERADDVKQHTKQICENSKPWNEYVLNTIECMVLAKRNIATTQVIM